MRELKKVRAKETSKALRAAISSLADNPYGKAEKLSTPDRAPVKPLYRIRVGQFRIVYAVDKDQLVVLVVSIGDRKHIYQKLKTAGFL